MNTNSTLEHLAEILDRVASRIVEDGTRTQERILLVMAEATRETCPGASAALVDWDGSEVMRLRAYGIVHGAVLRHVPATTQTLVLHRLSVEATHELAA